MLTDNSNKINLTSEIIKPSLIGLVVLFVAIILAVNWYHNHFLKLDVQKLPDLYNKTLHAELSDDVDKMRIALQLIADNEKLILALDNADRKLLMQTAEPVFRYLKENHNVTHFYFTGKDRKNILRLHQKERFGDTITRQTQINAEKSHEVSFGLELGPLGTFTLRVVKPVIRQHKVIGYIELGKEIDDLLERIESVLSVKSYILVNKKSLNKDGWKAGMKMLKRNNNWDYCDYLVAIQDYDSLFNSSKNSYQKIHNKIMSRKTIYLPEEDNHKGVVLPLYDAGNSQVGYIVILRDYSQYFSSKYKTQGIIFVVFVFLCGLLLNYLYKKARKTEKELQKYQANLSSEYLKRSQQKNNHLEELQRLALHDTLTGLPNRNLFIERLSHDVEICKRNNSSLFLFLLDIARLKDINDTLGHQSGDEILQMVASRLKDFIRESDTVCRLGADEFAVIFPSVDSIYIKDNIKKILKLFEPLFTLKGIPISVKVNIGVSVYPEQNENAEVLLQHADVAMRYAKEHKTEYVIYNPDNDSNSLSKLTLLTELQEGIKNNELVLYYQPKVNINSGVVSDVEALVRWQHPQRGLIPPAGFIELAEKAGIIKQITYWVINEAFSQGEAWRKTGINFKIAINISTVDLHDPVFIDKIFELIDNHSIDPSWFTLELTESALMTNPVLSLQVLNKLDEMGFTLSVDDFGTGYSSLAYLRDIPVNELKIDQSFIFNLIKNKDDAVIVTSTIILGHNLGLVIIAEGVEDAETFNKLKELGCDLVQGYYVSRPLPGDELIEKMKDSCWIIE